tara:strand:+ start:221 stop:1261 length:1041 start_codon:yes stop_codon:yes gene_type:complete
MADFTNLNLEGANEKLNNALTDAKALKDSLLASAGGDASTVLATLQSKVSDLQSSFSSMIPELPTIPNVNMQSEFATLANLDITSPQFTSQVANITSKFGPAMKDKGLDIESLAEQIQSGGDVGDLLPNLQLPAGEIIPVELPAEVSLPSIESVEEIISKVNKDTVSLKTPEVEVVIKVSGATKTTLPTTTTKTTTDSSGTTTTTTTTAGGVETINTFGNTEEEQKLIDAKDLNQKINQCTLIPGTFINSKGRELPLQRMTDAKIEELEVRAGIEYFDSVRTGKVRNANKPLSKGSYRRYFQSDTDDAGGRTDASFLAAKEQGDWNWKDDGDYLYYDNRYKKYRKT